MSLKQNKTITINIKQTFKMQARGEHYFKLPGSKIINMGKKDILPENDSKEGKQNSALPRMCTPDVSFNLSFT